MKQSLSLLLFLVICLQANAQTTAPRFNKYAIGNTAFSLYLPGTPDPFTESFSPDSARVTTVECLDSSQNIYYHFGAIVVELNDVYLFDEEEKEDMIESYLDYLKSAFNIEGAIGYGRGHSLESNSSAIGILDYWQDDTGDDWAVMGWATENALVVMFEYGPGAYPLSNVVDIFWKGIRFPGDE